MNTAPVLPVYRCSHVSLSLRTGPSWEVSTNQTNRDFPPVLRGYPGRKGLRGSEAVESCLGDPVVVPPDPQNVMSGVRDDT